MNLESVEKTLDHMSVDDKNGVKPEDDDFVDPWNVVSTSDTGVDYDKLISE
jgi:hypothetical protein